MKGHKLQLVLDYYLVVVSLLCVCLSTPTTTPKSRIRTVYCRSSDVLRCMSSTTCAGVIFVVVVHFVFKDKR